MLKVRDVDSERMLLRVERAEAAGGEAPRHAAEGGVRAHEVCGREVPQFGGGAGWRAADAGSDAAGRAGVRGAAPWAAVGCAPRQGEPHHQTLTLRNFSSARDSAR